jgi:hypothetical protein
MTVSLFIHNTLVMGTWAMYGWAVVAELGYLWLSLKAGDLITAVLMAIALTIIAFITDFHIVPKRFTPGFEKVVSRYALYTVYLCLAIGFIFGGMYRIN